MVGAVEQNRLLFVVEINNYGYHLVEVSIRGIFYPDSGSVPNKSSTRARATARARVTARARATTTSQSTCVLPSPVAEIRTRIDTAECIEFALAGTTIVGVSTSGSTFTCDARSGASSAGPELQRLRGRACLMPLGHRLYALSSYMYDLEQQSCGETLPLPGRRCQEPWRALPEPPPDSRCLDAPPVTAYFAAGTRLWVSAEGRGTCTFDTVQRAWRKEGDWELPFDGCGLVIPELGGLCFGLSLKNACLCALDIQQSPPTVRYMWKDTRPQWPPSSTSAVLYPERSLTYLGNGKFCISWNIGIGDHEHMRRTIFLTALQVVTSSLGKLRIVKHKVRFIEMPSQAQVAYALQPDLN